MVHALLLLSLLVLPPIMLAHTQPAGFGGQSSYQPTPYDGHAVYQLDHEPQIQSAGKFNLNSYGAESDAGSDSDSDGV